VSHEEKNAKIDFLRMSLTLFAIAALVAALLGLANYFTAPIIEESAEERLQSSLKSLIASADHFEEIDEFEETIAVNNKTIKVAAVYCAKNEKDELAGYCVQVQPKGYSDVIDMLVAIDAEGVVSGTHVLSMSDTPGIGMKVQSDEAFQKSVIGLYEPTKIVAGPSAENGVQAISGATISSTAYVNGVNAAIEAVAPLIKEVQP